MALYGPENISRALSYKAGWWPCSSMRSYTTKYNLAVVTARYSDLRVAHRRCKFNDFNRPLMVPSFFGKWANTRSIEQSFKSTSSTTSTNRYLWPSCSTSDGCSPKWRTKMSHSTSTPPQWSYSSTNSSHILDHNAFNSNATSSLPSHSDLTLIFDCVNYSSQLLLP